MMSPPVAPETLQPYEPPRVPHWGWRIAKAIAVVLVIIVVFFVGRDFAQRLAVQLSPDVEGSEVVAGSEIDVEIPPGASARAIGTLLEQEGVIADAADFELAVRRSGRAAELKAGRYTLVAGTDEAALVALLVAGPTPVEVYRVTVVEGLDIEAMLGSLAEQTPYTLAELEDALLGGSVFSSYLPEDALPEGVPDLARWEGLLFPDTYEFRADATPAEILQRLARTLETRLAGVDWSTVEDAGLTPYDGLVIASLIEREARLDEDRPLISSVIHNRLELGMLLQIDATVIYALGENPGRLLAADLEVESPYNTYRVQGLPPTPIGGVRLASLEAAAAPEETEYVYYVLVDESGKHGFSETLEEHNAKVAAARDAGVLP